MSASVMTGLGVVLGFGFGSMWYAFQYRGAARWESLSEYLRKGWPIFTPLNCLLYMFTKPKAQKALMDMADFPEFNLIQENWQVIREEAMNLYREKYFEATKRQGAGGSYDIGFRTFFKYGWGKFYINWYGYTHDSAKRLCPKTVEILSRVPQVKGAMFSLLPAGSQLTRHLDPAASSLRYHLGLMTPNSDDCFINVDGGTHSWRDGKAVIFDETYLHFAKNNTDKDRLILMCDIERPLYFIGGIVNFFYRNMLRLTVVPNLEGDKCGLVNRIFAGLSPVLKKTKELKKTNLALYRVVKYSVNTILFLMFVAAIGGVLTLVF